MASAELWKWWFADVTCMPQEPDPSDNRFACFSPFPYDSTSLEKLTVIFWTYKPEATWLPPCGHFTAEEHWSSPHICKSYTELWDTLVRTVRRLPDIQ